MNVQNYLPNVTGMTPNAWAGISALRFGKENAKRSWLNDLDLFVLDEAVRTEEVSYLYSRLWHYRGSRDVMGNLKRAIYRRFRELYQHNPEAPLRGIRDEKDMLIYIGFMYDEKIRAYPPEERLKKLSRLLEEDAVYETRLKQDAGLLGADEVGVIEKNLDPENNQYLFKDEYEGETVYIPQGLSSLMPLREVRAEEQLSPLPEAEMREIVRMRQEVEQVQRERNELRGKRDSAKQRLAGQPADSAAAREIQGEIGRLNQTINILNHDIDRQLHEIARRWSQPFVEWLKDKVETVRSHTGKPTVVVGIYGGAGTGKTTFTDILVDYLVNIYGQQGVDYMSVDSYLKPGRGLRYEQTPEGMRWVRIEDQPIYDMQRFGRDLRDLRDGRTIIAKKDEHAPTKTTSVTTYTENVLQGRREIDPNQLQVLILDLTIYGLDPKVLQEVDLLIPVVLGDDKIRLGRRKERDTRPKEEQKSSRGDSVIQTMNDFFEKQGGEVREYMRPMVERVVASKGEVVFWEQDENRLMELSGASLGDVQDTDEMSILPPLLAEQGIDVEEDALSGRMTDVGQARAPPEVGDLTTKKAPGTNEITNTEEDFYRQLSDRLMRGGHTQVLSVPEEIVAKLMEVFPVGEDKLERMLAHEISPASFRGRLQMLLKEGKLRLAIDDLGQKEIVKPWRWSFMNG